jgi:hypothetical protein
MRDDGDINSIVAFLIYIIYIYNIYNTYITCISHNISFKYHNKMYLKIKITDKNFTQVTLHSTFPK